MAFSDLHSLSQVDSELATLIHKEWQRQEKGLELIASENFTSKAIMEAQGSILTNKYAEGLPKKRYYGGCEVVDQIEELAIERAKKLFGAKFANVQPHSGSQANMGAYFSIIKPGDKILGMNLSEGGHLTHGSPVNFSGKLFEVVSYGLESKTEHIDYQQIRELAQKEKPQLIIAGASAYSKKIDFKIFREIADEVGAFLLVDMAHIAGLVAAGLHPSPIPHAHITTTTTHKTLRGPRGGLILTNDEKLAKKINSNIFPGIQGGPLEHVIAGKACCFLEALQDDFITYQKQVVANAHVLAETLKSEGLDLVSGGTENHLVLVKTTSLGLTGKAAENILEGVHITCNKNMIPKDTQSPFVTSGLRFGTPAITTRGLKENHIELLGKNIAKILKSPENSELKDEISQWVQSVCRDFPVYS